MKKFYSFLTAVATFCLLLCSTTVSAQASTENITLTFHIDIEDHTLCYIQNPSGGRVDLSNGSNTFTTTLHKTTYTDGSGYAYSDTYYLYIESDKQSDYRITDCQVEVDGSKSTYSNFYSSTTSLSIYFNSEAMNGCTLYPTISNLNDLRTATATVTVDDASKVQISCGGYMPTLENGTNTINFNPKDEANWTIGAKNYGEYLGGVKQNGTAVAESYGRFYLTVAQGDNIEITAAEDLSPVAVSFTGDVAAIKNVCKYINYAREAIDGDWKEGFEVAPRTQIIVTLDQNAYRVTSVTVNGKAQSIYSDDLYITISDVTEIAVTAVKYSTFSLHLEITDPAHITVAVAESQYSGSTELTGLVAGLQTLEISSKNTYLIVDKKDDCVIDTVKYINNTNDTTGVVSGYGGYYIPLTNAVKVIVESHAKVRNDVATLRINNINNCYTFYMQRSDNSYCFHSSCAPNPVPVTGDQTFNFDAESDNPISLYFSPKNYNDPGTVKVNGEAVYPVYEGATSYVMTLKNDDVVEVTMNSETTALNGVQAEVVGDNNVYNVQGVLIMRHAEAADLLSLPAGIYIMNGKKMVITNRR